MKCFPREKRTDQCCVLSVRLQDPQRRTRLSDCRRHTYDYTSTETIIFAHYTPANDLYYALKSNNNSFWARSIVRRGGGVLHLILTALFRARSIVEEEEEGGVLHLILILVMSSISNFSHIIYKLSKRQHYNTQTLKFSLIDPLVRNTTLILFHFLFVFF